MNKEIIIMNGKCLSMANQTEYDWLLVRDGCIYDIGFGADYKKLPEQFEHRY